jgi:predicted GH43/DUF377 family glycosyl hydrolase
MRKRAVIISVMFLFSAFFVMLEFNEVSLGQDPLVDDTPIMDDTPFSSDYDCEVLPGEFAVVGVRPEVGDDYDLEIYTDNTYTTLIDSSNTVGSGVDFVVMDKNEWASPPNRGVKVSSGSSNYVIEMENQIESHTAFDSWSGSMNWTSGNPVLDVGPSNSWDDRYVAASSVLYDGFEYHMWYQGHDGSKIRIGYANSSDGINWIKPIVGLIDYGGYNNNIVLDLGSPGSWDDNMVSQPTVVFDGSIYHMWYAGNNPGNIQFGYANSTDKVTWVRYPDPVLSKGGLNQWDDAYIHGPRVLYDGAVFHMWYYGDDGSNGRIGYAISSDGINWIKNVDNPVLDIGPPGSWDDNRVSSPAVIFKGNIYHMWYTGNDGSNITMGYAISPDGINWTKSNSNPILSVGPAGSWDSVYAETPSVVFNGTILQMWYTGKLGSTYRIGYATGYAKLPDKALWTKNEANPVLDTGPPSSWDDLKAVHPTVVFKDNLYHMWYAGLGPSGYKIGLANSTDGINWEKCSLNPVLDAGPSAWEGAKVETPTVLFDGTTFHMWYSGFNGAVYRIGYANSSNGIKWNKHSTPVLNPDTPWDNIHVYSPAVLYNEGTFHMWYSGYDGSIWRIGYATSTDGTNWSKSSANPVLDLGPPGSWDDERIYCPEVVNDKGQYHMWYSGLDGSLWRNGYASSIDGENWTKGPFNPILDLGPPGSWDSDHVSHPTVLYDGITFHMWYIGNETDSRTGYATYNINWTKYNSFSEVFDAFEITGLIANSSYSMELIVPPTADLDMFLYNKTGGRDDALIASTNIGEGIIESITFTAPTTGDYLLVITNEDGGSGTYSISFVDNPPLISDVLATPDPQVVFGTVNISANITDDIELYDAWIEIYDPQGGFVGNMTMQFDPITDKYYWIQTYDLLGTYTFTIFANDTNDFWSSSLGSFIIHDTTPPIIVNVTAIPDPQEVYFSVNISANITDNYQMDGAWIEVHDPLGVPVGNFLLIFDPINSKFYWIQTYDLLGLFTFTVWANDTSNNLNSESGSFLIRDTTPPQIIDVTAIPNPQEVYYSVNISSNITDNYQLYGAWIEVFNPFGVPLNNFSMIYDALNSRYYINQTYGILGTYSFMIWANDTSNNWVSEPGSFLIQDTTPPIIINVTAVPDPQEVYYSVNISANITDNYQIYGVWVDIDYPGGGPVGNFSMSYDFINDKYYWEMEYNELGHFLYTIWVNDTSNNWASYLNTFEIQDTTPPVIINTIVDPDPQEVYFDVRISAELSDNFQLDGEWIEIYDPFGVLVDNFSMSYNAVNDRFYLEQSYDLLGQYTFTIRAMDGADNWASDSGTFVIHDTTPPIISNPAAIPNPQEVYDSVNISATITDNYQIYATWIEIFNPDGNLFDNITMDFDSTFVRFFLNQDFDQLGVHSYKIWATDTSGNTESYSGTFVIQDTESPSILNANAFPDPQEVFGAVLISAHVFDNYDFSNIWIEIRDPDGILVANVPMEKSDLMDTYKWSQSYDSIGIYTYTIRANDTSDNLASYIGSFVIQDTTPPVISDVVVDQDPQIYRLL